MFTQVFAFVCFAVSCSHYHRYTIVTDIATPTSSPHSHANGSRSAFLAFLPVCTSASFRCWVWKVHPEKCSICKLFATVVVHKILLVCSFRPKMKMWKTQVNKSTVNTYSIHHSHINSMLTNQNCSCEQRKWWKESFSWGAN